MLLRYGCDIIEICQDFIYDEEDNCIARPGTHDKIDGYRFVKKKNHKEHSFEHDWIFCSVELTNKKKILVQVDNRI